VYRDSLTSAIRRQPTRLHVASIAVLLLLVFVASVASAELRFPGSATAPWWLAAGVSVIAVFAGRGRGLVVAALIVPVTAAANLLSGTVWWMALGFGIANATEAWVVVAITTYRRQPGHRFRHYDAVRFILATAGGAFVIGVLVGAIVAANGGDPIATAAHVAASHGSSVLLIGVLGVVPRPSFVPRLGLELALQVAALGIAIGLAFGPFTHLPMAFLPFPVLAWAAFRFTAGVTLIEIALTSVAVAVLSFLGRGSLAALTIGDPELLVAVIQIFTLSVAASLLPLAVAQDDRTDLYQRLTAREHLLRGAIVSAHAGFIVARREDGGAYRVLESNPNGERMLASWLNREGDTTFVDSTRVAELTGSEIGGVTDIESEGVHLELTATPVDGDGNLLLIQAIDVTEQSKAARALADAFVHEREAADRLRTLAAQKDEFVSSVSHELRTPVTSILGYSEDLSEADLPESERRSVEIIMRNARRLAELVDDLLNMSREAGLPPAASTAIDVRAAIGQCVEDLSAIADRARVTVEVADGDDYVITGDRLGLDRILVNLLANAIKFTPPGGRIDISLSAAPEGFARIEVADTGRGIPPDEVDKVFERFYRVTGEKEFVPGTGLGLPIVRDLVTRMGGRVELTSDGVSGTTAIVELPLFIAAALPGAAGEARSGVVN
jgi:two-component system phosphate regulon sensor histidine kinase PhoR